MISRSLLMLCLAIICLLQSSMAWMPSNQQYQQRISTSKTRRFAASAQTQTQQQSEKELIVLPSANIAGNVFETDKRPVVLFDGVCNMCNNAVNLALDWDPKGNLRFAALQGNVGRALLEVNGRRADDISSIVLVSEDGAFIKSDAILKITEALAPPFLPAKPAAKLGQLLVPQFLRDLIYDQVADNRYSIMGVRNECRFDADGQFDDRFVDEKLAYNRSI